MPGDEQEIAAARDAVETARAELEEFERARSAGEPVGQNQRVAVNATYQAAEAMLAELTRTESDAPAQTISAN